MSSVDHDLFGNSTLYLPFRLITEVLGKFVSCAPRTLTLAQLAQQTARPARELTKLCGVLCHEQLLQSDPGQRHSWRLACPPGQLTLEDAFRCALAVQAARARLRPARQPEARENGGQREVDLMMTQAAMDINQSVFQHLRRFSLDRLKAAAPSRSDTLDRLYRQAVFS